VGSACQGYGHLFGQGLYINAEGFVTEKRGQKKKKKKKKGKKCNI
jgi:hypothetical protein